MGWKEEHLTSEERNKASLWNRKISVSGRKAHLCLIRWMAWRGKSVKELCVTADVFCTLHHLLHCACMTNPYIYTLQNNTECLVQHSIVFSAHRTGHTVACRTEEDFFRQQDARLTRVFNPLIFRSLSKWSAGIWWSAARVLRTHKHTRMYTPTPFGSSNSWTKTSHQLLCWLCWERSTGETDSANTLSSQTSH